MCTLTATPPAAWAGLVTYSRVGLTTRIARPVREPKPTPWTPTKLCPLTRTTVPPAVGPDAVPRAVTDGGATKVNRSPDVAADVPWSLTSRTFTVPAPCRGVRT